MSNNAFAQLCDILSEHPAPAISHTEPAWHAILKQAERHRVKPLLLDSIHRNNIQIPRHPYTVLKAAHKSNAIMGLKINRAAALVAQLFQENGIEHCLFKGITLNYLLPGNFSCRHNGDLDVLLIDKSMVTLADTLLSQLGFNRSDFSPLSTMKEYQIKLLQKYEKDLIYYSPSLDVKLELHLRLFVNDRIMPISNQDIHAESTQVQIGGQPVSLMSLAHHQIYLLLHGATSIWFRLKWVCDLPAISNGGEYYLSKDFEKAMRELSIERMACQGLMLAHKTLNMRVSHQILEHHQNSPTSLHFLAHAEDHLQRPPPSQLRGFVKAKYWFFYVLLYLPMLKPGLAYKLRSLGAYGTRKSDWEVIQLPASLGWVYLLFRPFFWIFRQFRLKKP